MKRMKVELPACGMFVGSGIYPMSKDYLLCTMLGHPGWSVQDFHPLELIDKIVEDNQGNLAQVWGVSRGYAPATHAQWFYALDEIGINVPDPDWQKGTNTDVKACREIREHADRKGAGLLRFMKAAAKKGIYTTFIYTSSEPEWVRRFGEVGSFYLGYDFGERYSFSLDSASVRDKDLSQVTLRMLAEDLVARVRQHVDERHASGWGNVMATSSNFFIDYEIAAGTDVPVVEDFAFCHLNLASALSRGLYRQYDLPMWGSHLAHEHYSWLPWKSPHKFDLLRAAMYQKYMAGSKMIINESGNWFVEATLCEDSPKFEIPPTPLGPRDVSWGGGAPPKFVPYIEEARKHFGKVDYTSPYCRSYRKVISDFYDFVKANGTPAGQPETTVAVAKGNFDLCCHRFMPNYAIGGALALADRNPAWFEGAPERGWEIVRKVFYPLRTVLDPYPNLFLSGSPHGMVDVVSFALDQIDAEMLNANYKALLFSGWNTSSDKQYAILKQYVANGGKLFIAIPHLSTNDRRNYGTYTVDELVNGGDFSELCGVRVKGKGDRFYWATAPYKASDIGFKFPRRFGILATPMGNIEITDPSAETLVVDDELERPVLLRRRYGKGEVYFLNSWAYPGAMEADDGPGGRVNSTGLIGAIYQHMAMRSRGNVWITDDGVSPGAECDYVTYSYFPEGGEICLLNVDFERPHRFQLHQFGTQGGIELAPGEFRMMKAVRR